MFANELYNLTLANDVADRLFDHITATYYGHDRTFMATLRAVLHRRLPTTQSVHVAFIELSSQMLTVDRVAESIRLNDAGYSYSIFIVFPQRKSYGPHLFDTARTYLGEGKPHLNDYVVQDDLRLFYIKKLDGLFYRNDHSMLIFLDSLDIRQFHALQIMIPKYLPTLFADNPLSEEETSLLKSLDNKTPEAYERLIEDFARRLDMRGEIIRTRLKGFETVFEREQIQKIAQHIEKRRRDYQHTLEDLRRIMNDMQDQQIVLAGLQSRIQDADRDDSELMDYFLCNKNLSVICVMGTEVVFIVHGYADVFDEEGFETYAGNPDSYLYDDIGDISQKQMESLYRAIFENGEYRLRVCAAYRADMRNSITPLRGYAFPPESRDYLPNPHIQKFACIGGYATRFAEYMFNRDYIGAIEQAAVSARNLNFYDSAVMGVLAHDLAHTGIKCVEDGDGNLMTPREAIKKLEVSTCQSPSESPTR